MCVKELGVCFLHSGGVFFFFCLCSFMAQKRFFFYFFPRISVCKVDFCIWFMNAEILNSCRFSGPARLRMFCCPVLASKVF